MTVVSVLVWSGRSRLVSVKAKLPAVTLSTPFPNAMLGVFWDKQFRRLHWCPLWWVCWTFHFDHKDEDLTP
jgi:hypothetical protein